MNTLKNLPQGPKNHPLFQLFQWMNNTLEYMDTAQQKYGDLFTVCLGSKTQPTVYVSNPEAIQQIFNGESKEFTNPGNQLFKPVLGQNALGTLTGKRHQRHRQLIMPCFHGNHLQAYAKLICDTTEEMFKNLTAGQTFSAHTITEEISGKVILKAVFGNHQSLQQLNQLTSSVLDFFAKNPIASSLLFLPFLRTDLGRWSPWGYVCHLMRQIDNFIYAEIAERRQNFDPHRTDILNLLMAAKDEAGEGMSEQELRDELVMLIFGGKDAVASAMAWSLYWVNRSNNVQEKLQKELMSIGSEENPLNIARLPYLNAVCQEILRISPVEIQGQPRIVSSPVELVGYKLPVGTVLIPSIYLVHRREDLYPNPEQFKPERFLNQKFSYYEYLPFGGGSRRCIGSAFAQLTLKLFLATTTSRYQLKLVSAQPVRPTLRGLNLIPHDGVKMTFLGQSTMVSSPLSSATV
ncbi:cytochrome P450 [Capilliphycus salinus ALCB114379]|uniref:cytochrome P450 n=1 Tax=Capilliphycus salinus TaxID=2768948 RepID=UPI0039A678B9